jgi:hypothetical protein
MKRTTWLCALAVLALAACGDSPMGPSEIPLEPVGTVDQVQAFQPAIEDVNARVLSSGGDRSVMNRLSGFMSEIGMALAERDARRADRAVAEARALAAACDDDCLAAPERSVIDLTLDFAARLIGLDANDR